MSETPSYLLNEAALKGDIDALNQLLTDGSVSVDDRDAEGKTPLFCAAWKGQETAVRHLLKWGARVDTESSAGVTPLMTAARGGHASVVRLLLVNGADPDQTIHPRRPELTPKEQERLRELAGSLEMPVSAEAVAKAGQRSQEPRGSAGDNLRRAIAGGDLETLAAFLEAGVPPDSTHADVRTPPLFFATALGRIDMIRLLIQHGADVNATSDGQELTVLHNAIMNKRVDVARVLLEMGAETNCGTMPPLAFSVFRDDIEMAKLLLTFGANPNFVSGGVSPAVMALSKPEFKALFAEHQGTDWHEAVKRGDLDEVRAKLDAGANVDVRSDESATALHIASEAGHAAVVELLLDRGAELNAANKHQQTPLLLAIGKDRAEVARLLVASGADIHATNRWGQTAIFLAAVEKRREISDILIAAGARVGIVEAARIGDNAAVMAFLADGVPVDQRNEAGLTALMATAERGDIELATILHDRGADIEARDKCERSPLMCAVGHAVQTGSTEFLDLLLEWGVAINGVGKSGRSVLYDALVRRSATIVGYLLRHGADPNARMLSVGWPALHTAIRMSRGDISCVRVLLDNGADIELAERLGETPLMAAVNLTRTESASGSEDGGEWIRDLVRLLIERGANVNASSGVGAVLAVAAEAGDVDVVRLLLDAGADPIGSDIITPVARASMHGQTDVVALLRERGGSDRSPGEAEIGIPEGFTSAMLTAVMQPGFLTKMQETLNKARQKRTKP